MVQDRTESSGCRAAPQRARDDRLPSPSRAAAPLSLPERDNLFVGIAALLANTLCFALSDVAAKYLTLSLPPVEVAWLRYVVFCLAIAPLFVTGGKSVVATARPMLHLVRGLTAALSTALFIVSLNYLPVAEATALSFALPIFITALAVVFLKEKVGVRRWSAALVGLLGVLIIVRPGTAAFQPASLLALAAAFMGAATVIVTRLMKNERTDTTMVYTALAGTAVLSVLAAFQWVTPSLFELGVGLIAGGFGALANLTLILAYRRAAASALATFSYTQLIWASGLGYAVFGILPGPSTYVGAAVIAASGLYIAYRERKLAGAA